jgi:chemotaxis protein MotB
MISSAQVGAQAKGALPMKKNALVVLLFVLAMGLVASGCSNKKLMAQKDAQIVALQEEVGNLEGEAQRERERAAQLQAELDRALSESQRKEQVWMEEKDGLTQITLDGAVAFGSGSTRITTEGKRILDDVFGVVEKYSDRWILIEGHTDDVPVAEKWQYRFRSNWELSSARAHAVLHYVQSKFGIDADRLAAVGYGEYHPVADNSTEAGRSMNRRVVITIGSRLQMAKMLP